MTRDRKVRSATGTVETRLRQSSKLGKTRRDYGDYIDEGHFRRKRNMKDMKPDNYTKYGNQIQNKERFSELNKASETRCETRREINPNPYIRLFLCQY